jgi:hypothetical protein
VDSINSNFSWIPPTWIRDDDDYADDDGDRPTAIPNNTQQKAAQIYRTCSLALCATTEPLASINSNFWWTPQTWSCDDDDDGSAVDDGDRPTDTPNNTNPPAS